MPVPLVGFQSLLWSLAFKAGLNPDPTFGTVNMKDFDVASFVDFLNDAVLWAWKPDPERPEIVWPYTVKTVSATPSAGKIDLATLEYADWWRVWSADPRVYAAAPTAYPVSDTWDNDGVWPRTALSPVFVFYRPMRPMFTYTPALTDSGTVYALGSLVWDKDVSGNVFKAIVANAHGNALTDPTKWTLQAVPDPLVKPILTKAEAFRVKSKGNDPAKFLAEADALLAAEKARALPANGPGAPWSFDYT